MTDFFDLQVNGYGGIDFNQDALTAEQLHTACAKLAEHGVGGILATIITERLELMCERLKRLVKLRAADPLATKMIAGLHIEGPFLSTKAGYPGGHPVDAIVPPDGEAAKRLLDAGGGLVRLVTLAPERDTGSHVTKLLVGRGIIVSAGHCDPSVEQLQAAIDAGLSMFTHLGNGCPMHMHRHDNVVQRALSLHKYLWLCFIADGIHIAFPALGNYLRAVSPERCVIVTDAVAPAGLGPGHYTLGRRWILNVGPDLACRAPDGSHLLGAAITMRQSEANLRQHLGLSDEQCRRLLVENPRRSVGLRADNVSTE